MINFGEVTGENRQEHNLSSVSHKKARRSWKDFKDLETFIEYSNDFKDLHKSI